MPQHRVGTQRLSGGMYKEDKAAGLVQIKTKVKDEVILEKKRFSQHTGEELDTVIITTSKKAAEAEIGTHEKAIESLRELIADIDAL